MADKTDSNKDNDLNEPSNEDDVISSDNAYSRQRRRGFLRLVLYFIIALAFAAVVVMFGRWLYHRVHKANHTTSQPTTNTVPTPTPSTPSTQPSSPTSTSNASNSTSTTQVANTGPGNVVAIFIGTAIAIGGLHFIYSLRRA